MAGQVWRLDLRHARRTDRTATVGRQHADAGSGLPAHSRSSKAGDDGWLTLSGTAELERSAKSARMAGDQPIETRTNGDGLLEAKVGKQHDAVDVILVVTK